jgi:hypothetical protein
MNSIVQRRMMMNVPARASRVVALASAIAVWSVACRGSDAPSAEAQRILDDARFGWVTIASPHARIHFLPSSYAAAHEDTLAARVEGARSAVLDRLGIGDYETTLDVFYVDSRQDMNDLVGRPVTGFAYYRDAAIVLVLNDRWRAFERHELTHFVTYDTWPDGAGPAVVEGLATYVDGACGGYPNGRVARTILDRGEMIPLAVLAADFRSQDDLVAYLEAGSVVEFVAQRRGANVMHTLWSEGLQAAPDLLGIPVTDFDPQFEHWLSVTYDPVPDTAWAAIRSGGCGIDARATD